jgi:hypothetical protein
LGLEGDAFDRAAIGLVIVFVTGMAILIAVLATGRRRRVPRDCGTPSEGSASRSVAGDGSTQQEA